MINLYLKESPNDFPSAYRQFYFAFSLLVYKMDVRMLDYEMIINYPEIKSVKDV